MFVIKEAGKVTPEKSLRVYARLFEGFGTIQGVIVASAKALEQQGYEYYIDGAHLHPDGAKIRTRSLAEFINRAVGGKS